MSFVSNWVSGVYCYVSGFFYSTEDSKVEISNLHISITPHSFAEIPEGCCILGDIEKAEVSDDDADDETIDILLHQLEKQK
jgi:hypothetical protein